MIQALRKASFVIILSAIGIPFNGCGYLVDSPEKAEPPAQKQAKKEVKVILSFGIVPQQAASKLARLWSPILQHVSRKAGVKLTFSTAKDIPTFEERCKEGKYDLAYMNPYHYTVYHETQGYIAIGKQKDKQIQGILVVRKDSKAKSLADFANTILAFPAPAAFAASILPRAGLKAANVPFKANYVSSHDSVYRGVAKGLYPCGGGIVRTFKNMDPTIAKQLKIFWKTAKYTPHAIAIHPKVPANIRQAIAKALIELSDSAKGKALLESIKFKGVEAAVNKDWDDVRKLGLKNLADLKSG
jgi:phosphonate transport system substrate-binding protein